MTRPCVCADNVYMRTWNVARWEDLKYKLQFSARRAIALSSISIKEQTMQPPDLFAFNETLDKVRAIEDCTRMHYLFQLP